MEISEYYKCRVRLTRCSFYPTQTGNLLLYNSWIELSVDSIFEIFRLKRKRRLG